MRTFLRAVAVLAVLALVAALAYGWLAQRRAGAPGSPHAAAAVHVARVEVRQLPQILSVQASLRDGEKVLVRPQIVARVAQVLFHEGDRVVRGHVLVRLDDSADKVELEHARGNVTEMQARYRRSQELRAKGFLGRDQEELSQRALEEARARVRELQARLAAMVVRAPVTGIAAAPAVRVNEVVEVGEAVTTLRSLELLPLEVRVPEMSLPVAKAGQEVEAVVDEAAGADYPCKIVSVRAVNERNARAVEIRAIVRNRDGRLRPGMRARVQVPTSGARDALVVPDEAVMTMGSESAVYKVVQGKAVREKVELGQDAGASVEVVAGLAPGDVVATSGLAQLRDGDAVAVAADAPR
jgi:membrane fusion protein (multidrug efflux system)